MEVASHSGSLRSEANICMQSPCIKDAGQKLDSKCRSIILNLPTLARSVSTWTFFEAIVPSWSDWRVHQRSSSLNWNINSKEIGDRSVQNQRITVLLHFPKGMQPKDFLPIAGGKSKFDGLPHQKWSIFRDHEWTAWTHDGSDSKNEG